MCGIAGLIGAGNEVQPIVAAMGRTIRQRGPDGGGVVGAEGATLGMARLGSVVEHRHRPMQSDDGAVALVYSGEVNNAPALREELRG